MYVCVCRCCARVGVDVPVGVCVGTGCLMGGLVVPVCVEAVELSRFGAAAAAAAAVCVCRCHRGSMLVPVRCRVCVCVAVYIGLLCCCSDTRFLLDVVPTGLCVFYSWKRYRMVR